MTGKCKEGKHNFRIKELQCEKCGEISLLLKDKVEFCWDFVNDLEESSGIEILRLREENQNLKKRMENVINTLTSLRKDDGEVERALRKENQKLKDANVEQTERIYELLADSGKLVQENKRLKEELIEWQDGKRKTQCEQLKEIMKGHKNEGVTKDWKKED